MRARITIPLDRGTLGLLAKVSCQTGMLTGEIIAKLLSAHVSELAEFVEYLEQLPSRPMEAQKMAPWLMHNFGPEGLAASIKQIDPSYQTLSERFRDGVE